MLLLGSATGSGAIIMRAGNSDGWGRSLLACLVDPSLADCAGAIILARRLAEDQKEAGMLSEAETTCRDLSRVLRDDPGQLGSSPLLRGDVTLELARTVRAQGRLDEARQLCEEANGQLLVHTFLTGSYDHQRLCNSRGFVVCLETVLLRYAWVQAGLCTFCCAMFDAAAHCSPATSYAALLPNAMPSNRMGPWCMILGDT